jgi:hypothetical protein
MQRILSKRRLVVVVGVVGAAALVSTAAGAVRVGLPGIHSAVSGGAGQLGTAPLQRAGVPANSGILEATASCASQTASRTVMTHSADAVHHMWVVHVARPLCSSLFVQEAAYRKPLQGGVDYPQQLSTTGRLVRMQAPGTYKVPWVARSSCVQTDAGANWNSPPRWPATLPRLGAPQPQQLSHWSVGPNTWTSARPTACKPFLPPPAPTVKVQCPLDCTGIAHVTLSAKNPVTFAGLMVVPFLNGKMISNRALRLGPGASGSVLFFAHDGDTITLAYVYPNSSHPPLKPVGRAVKVQCPPGAPPLVVSMACPCAGDVTGTVQATNASRYPLQVAVLVNGVQQAIITVAAKKSGTVSLTTARQATLTFGYRYNLTGQFPATFTRISFKVATTA